MSELEKILTAENETLDKILEKQKELRGAVKEKKWEHLMDTTAAIDALSDTFVKAEEERHAFSEKMYFAKKTQSENEKHLLAQVRKKLLESKIMNKSLGEYISITRGFVQGVIDEALPQSRTPVYSRTGNIIRKKPLSVVVNTVS